MPKLKVSLDNGATWVEVDNVKIEAPADSGCPVGEAHSMVLTFNEDGMEKEVFGPPPHEALGYSSQFVWDDLWGME